MRSPSHLAGTVILVVAIIVATGIVLPRLVGGNAGGAAPGGEPTTSGTAPSSTETEGSTSPLPTRLSAPLVSPTTAKAAPAALRVAEQWAAAWVKHPKGTTNEQWLEGLRPYTTPEYLPQMRTVNPANIPATRVTGKATATSSYTSSVEAEVPTDGPKLAITVVRTDTGWRVAQYDQAR